MYYVFVQEELGSGYHYADLSDKKPETAVVDKWGNSLKLVSFETFEKHHDGVCKLLALRTLCNKHNIALNPLYVPRSKRSKRS